MQGINRGTKVFALMLGLLISGCTSVDFEETSEVEPGATVQYALDALPFPEQWTSIEFSGDPVGFTHQLVSSGEQPEEMRIDSQAYLRFYVLGVEKQAIVVGTDWVSGDLTLKRFRYRYTVDNRVKKVVGEVADGQLLTTVSADGETVEQRVPLSRPLYPGRAIGLYPVVRGLALGKQFAFHFFDGETEVIKPVVQTVESFGTGEKIEGSAYKLVSQISGSSTTTWIDTLGRPLLEVSFGGIFFASLQETETARRNLVEQALSKDPALLPYTRIPVDPGLSATVQSREMTVRLDGLTTAVSVPSDSFQHCWIQSPATLCQILVDTESAAVELQIDFEEYLATNHRINWDTPSIAEVAEFIRTDTDGDPLARADAAYEWVVDNIKLGSTPAESASAAVEGRRGDHRDLTDSYIAIARALRVPTRHAHGVRYSAEDGAFVYQTWAESWVDGIWYRLDPALGERRADATHVKLVAGDLEPAIPRLAQTIGRLSLEVLSYDAPEF